MTVKTHLKLVILYLLILACFTHRCKSLCRFSFENLRDGEIKGMFVFGSSLVDNGNNNFLGTKAKADYLPYVIDFPNGSSGRFTNGKNVVDLLGEQLKLPSLIGTSIYGPSNKGSRIVEGVNHGSGSAGILNDTGSVAVSQNHSSFYFLSLSSFLSSLNVLCFSPSLLPFLFFSPHQAWSPFLFLYYHDSRVFVRFIFLYIYIYIFKCEMISNCMFNKL